MDPGHKARDDKPHGWRCAHMRAPGTGCHCAHPQRPAPAYPHFMHNLLSPAAFPRGWQRAKRAAWQILRRWSCMAPRVPTRSPQPTPAAPPASRSASPCSPWSGRGAGRWRACAARGCCAGAIARPRPTSCCWRRPTCAAAMPPSPTRPPPAASGSPASSPISRDARRLRPGRPTPRGRARCTASAGCAISRPRNPPTPGPWRSSSSANGSGAAGGRARTSGRPRSSAAASSPGCRMRACCSMAPSPSATPPSWAASRTRSPISRRPGAMRPTAIPASSP